MSRSSSMRASRLREESRITQGLAEMVGVARGIIADGRISSEEAAQLAQWARENPDVAQRWPANVLARRLDAIVRDGRVDAREKRRLAAMLAQLAQNPGGLTFALATDLPVDRPQPDVTFEGRTFVFAGDMLYGPLRSCEREVVELGGEAERTVSKRTDFVVIGGLASAEWSQEGFGTLVDDVVQLRSRGAKIAIISEEHWAAALP